MPVWIAAIHPFLPLGAVRRFLRIVVLAVPLIGPVAGSATTQEVGAVGQTAPAVSAGEIGGPDIAAPPPSSSTDAPSRAAAAAPAGAKDHDLSPVGMFLHADPVVQGVMILLACASMASWVVLLVKGLGLRLARRRLNAGLAAIGVASSLAERRTWTGPSAASSATARCCSQSRGHRSAPAARDPAGAGYAFALSRVIPG